MVSGGVELDDRSVYVASDRGRKLTRGELREEFGSSDSDAGRVRDVPDELSLRSALEQPDYLVAILGATARGGLAWLGSRRRTQSIYLPIPDRSPSRYRRDFGRAAHRSPSCSAGILAPAPSFGVPSSEPMRAGCMGGGHLSCPLRVRTGSCRPTTPRPRELGGRGPSAKQNPRRLRLQFVRDPTRR